MMIKASPIFFRKKLIVYFVILSIAAFALPVHSARGISGTNLASNPGFEETGSTTPALGWQNFGSGYKRVGASRSGSWSVKLINNTTSEQSGAYQRIDLNQTEPRPVFIGGYVRGRSITMAPGSYFGASLYAEIHLDDGSVVYWNSVPNFGTFRWRWIGFNTGSPFAVGQNSSIIIDQPIDYIFVVPILGDASGRAWFDDISVVEYEPAQSAITLMFDDGEENAYTEAKPVLDSYGFRGTVSVPSGTIGDEGFMGKGQLQGLTANGWEVVSHGVNHIDLTALSKREAKRELRKSLRNLQRFGFTVNSFALPFGAYNSEIIADGTGFYRSLRAFEIGDNPQGTFPYDVKVKAVKDSTTPDEVSGWVNDAINNKRWLVLVFHSIAETGDDAFHTDPLVFSEIVNRVASSGIDVVTYNEGLDAFAVTE